MRISSYAVARPAYYDRNAASVTAEYVGTVGPHAGTNRFTYTVASGKKLITEFAYSSMYRATVAAPVGQYSAIVFAQVGANTPRFAYIDSVKNTVDATQQTTTAGAITIYAGESLNGYTSDASTGGTVSYILQAKGTLFDA